MSAWTSSLKRKELQYINHKPHYKTRSTDQAKRHVVIRPTVDNLPYPDSRVHPGFGLQTHEFYIKSGPITLNVRNVAIDDTN